MGKEFFSLIIIGALIVGGLTASDSFAIDYRDSTGYTPTWAKGQGYHYVLNECNYLIGDTSRDGNWCYEWVAYVLDQGVENFPQSTSGNIKSIPNFTLEDGPLYFGDLNNFLPDTFTYGDDWLVGKPFTVDVEADMSKSGVRDIMTQRIVIPDQWDETNFMTVSYMITEFENSNTSNELFSNIKKEIHSQNYPTVSEYFELESQGISNGNLEIERDSQNFVTDCIGQMKNLYEKNEKGVLTCVKDNYIIAVQTGWKDAIYNTSFTMGTPESALESYAEIIVNNIDNQLHGNSEIVLPNDAKFVAYQYFMEEINDEQVLDYFQKAMDDGKIQFPTDSIMIAENSQRLSYIPDLPRAQMFSWGEGRMTDSQFAETLIWLVERGYLTIPGFDSSSITVSSDEREGFFDIPEEKTTEIETAKTTTSSTREKSSSSNDEPTPMWAMGLAVFIVIGLPIIIIGFIIRKIKKRKK